MQANIDASGLTIAPPAVVALRAPTAAHLRKLVRKLEITSRTQLADTLPA